MAPDRPILRKANTILIADATEEGGYRRAAYDALEKLGFRVLYPEQVGGWTPLSQLRSDRVRDGRTRFSWALNSLSQLNPCSGIVTILGRWEDRRTRDVHNVALQDLMVAARRHRIPTFLFAIEGSSLVSFLKSAHSASLASAGWESLAVTDSVLIEVIDSPEGLTQAIARTIGEVLSQGDPRRLIVFPPVGPELVARLLSDPEDLHQIPDRLFEELIADLLTRDGWAVDLIVRPNASGPDIIACSSQLIRDVPLRMIVECKRYRADRPVGVDEVRNLVYWVNDQYQATLGMLVTTSRFTVDAQALADERHRWRVSLRDHRRIIEWVQRCGLRTAPPPWTA